MAEAGEDKRHRQHAKQGGQRVTPDMYGRHAGRITDQCKREQRNEPGQENGDEQEPLRTASREYRIVFKLLLNSITPEHPGQIKRDKRTRQGANHCNHCPMEHTVNQARGCTDRQGGDRADHHRENHQ